MNILFFLTPKASCEVLYDDESIREALERMELSGFAALPIIRKEDGVYRGTLTDGDVLWALKNQCNLDLKEAQLHSIMEIAHRKDYLPVSVSTDMNDLLQKALDQNFVPVVDDRGSFIGIVTRKTILAQYIASIWDEA
ncbi:MAG: CBS domain-containing protein [Oscillospiraceae bacterium]|jgi:FOG: CBS domain|nr:CBS domain-containing protein [Oscillospiraceae bacterium]